MILQPNIRYVGPAYWDYIDYHIALTEHSLVEALEVTGYRIERLIPRFLPYTAKSNLGRLMEGSNVEGLVKFILKHLCSGDSSGKRPLLLLLLSVARSALIFLSQPQKYFARKIEHLSNSALNRLLKNVFWPNFEPSRVGNSWK